MSAYTANVGTTSVSIATPPGSIMAYLGSNDPDGWVICDGVARINTNGRYNNLITMSIGSGIGGNYTPPNYKGAFLRGTGTTPDLDQSAGTLTYNGPAINTSQMDSVQQIQISVFATQNNVSSNSGSVELINTNGEYRNTIATSNTPNWTKVQHYVNSIFSSTEFGIVRLFGLRTSNETRPYNFGVNWILKL